MCGLIFETALLLCGLWAIATGKIPAIVFGKKYKIEGMGARLIGAILVLPLPLSIAVGVALILLVGEDDATGYVNATALLILLIALLAAWVIGRAGRQPAQPASAPTQMSTAGADFTPRMPTVEPLPNGLVEFARGMAANTDQRELVIITPGRNVITSGALPPLNTLHPTLIADLEAIAPSDRPWQIVAIGLTERDLFEANAYQAVPFLSILEGLVQLGHAVILFEGHPSALLSVCRDADLLIVDGQMTPFLQSDWQETALTVLRQPNIIKVNRQGTEILGLQKWNPALAA